MRIEGRNCIIRSWRQGDEVSLVKYADNYEIWRNLRDAFPHPYTLEDAVWWINYATTQTPEVSFTIEVDGEAAGGIGLVPGVDVERIGAEVGYWLGEPFWGRGITTEALQVFSTFAMRQFGLIRLFALPFLRNSASIRVLEKVGYEREAILKSSAMKEGVILDQALYALVLEHTNLDIRASAGLFPPRP